MSYVGLDLTDIAALYRNRAAEIADGTQDLRPVLSVVVEFYAHAQPSVLVLGNGRDPGHRENLSHVLEAIGVLSEGAATCNAQASN